MSGQNFPAESFIRPQNTDLHPVGGRRATIKAHPATPHHPRPYGKGTFPARMESPEYLLIDKLGDTIRSA